MGMRAARRVGGYVAIMSVLTASVAGAQDASEISVTGRSSLRNHAQWVPPLSGDPMPLTTAVLAAARTQAAQLEQAPPEQPSSPGDCRKRAVLGTVIGAGVGAATAAGLLAATGGSDSTFKILFNLTGVGAVGGLVLGSSSCRK